MVYLNIQYPNFGYVDRAYKNSMRSISNPREDGAETARPTQEFRIVRALQGHDGKKKETVGRRHGIPPHTPPAVPPDFLIFGILRKPSSNFK
jgi:hypothetical protein